MLNFLCSQEATITTTRTIMDTTGYLIADTDQGIVMTHMSVEAEEVMTRGTGE